MKWIVMILAMATLAHAQTPSDENANREPDSKPPLQAGKHNYPGAADEEDLQVQNHLPEATLKTDPRSLQKGVYKTLYNEELKDEGREAVEE